MKKRFHLALFAVAMTIAPQAALGDAADDAIEARRAFYQVVKHNAGGLFAMAKGEAAYDAALASALAANLDALTRMDNGSMWPAGSDNGAKPGKTRAKPEIWTTYPAIGEKSDAWKTAAADLSANAGLGLDALRSKIGALGASCKGCHDVYRAEDF